MGYFIEHLCKIHHNGMYSVTIINTTGYVMMSYAELSFAGQSFAEAVLAIVYNGRPGWRLSSAG